jgi:hypothetical protein
LDGFDTNTGVGRKTPYYFFCLSCASEIICSFPVASSGSFLAGGSYDLVDFGHLKIQ